MTNKKLIFDFNLDIAIKTQNLNLYYESFQALKNINIDINKNSVTAFIGPSGCGKSTLLKTFNRMNDLIPNCKIEGNIEIGGCNIYDNNINVSYLRKNVGMVFQKSNLFAMSVYDNIAYGPRTFGIKKKSELNDIVEYSLIKAALWDEIKDRLNKNALGLSGCVTTSATSCPASIIASSVPTEKSGVPMKITLILLPPRYFPSSDNKCHPNDYSCVSSYVTS